MESSPPPTTSTPTGYPTKTWRPDEEDTPWRSRIDKTEIKKIYDKIEELETRIECLQKSSDEKRDTIWEKIWEHNDKIQNIIELVKALQKGKLTHDPDQYILDYPGTIPEVHGLLLFRYMVETNEALSTRKVRGILKINHFPDHRETARKAMQALVSMCDTGRISAKVIVYKHRKDMSHNLKLVRLGGLDDE